MSDEKYPNENKTKSAGFQGFLKGIPSSSGIAVGKALIIEPDLFISSVIKIPEEKIEEEILRFKNASDNLINDFKDVLANSNLPGTSAQPIIETYQYLISDEFIISNIIARIQTGFDAESSVIREYDNQKELFRNTKDELLRERAIDLDNVKRRLVSFLRHHTPDYSLSNGKILVAQTLSPTDLVKYKEAGAVGIITEMGGIASHLSILCRSFEMPAVIGVKDAAKIISDEIELIIDGFSGLIIYNPDYPVFKRYEKRINEIEEHKKSLGKLVKITSETSDKRRIHLLANIDRLEDIKSSLISGCEGIGLVRSESLLANQSKIPNEEIQYSWYREIAERIYPNPVTIRCFDVGSDKFSVGIPTHENNPALGLRGIRYLLYSRRTFITQIRAILRASSNKNVKIMLPMISDLSEIMAAKDIITECMFSLEKEKIPFDSKISVGVMIETPAAALTSYDLARECDFFSIGTNDLTQYTLAADRTNDMVMDVYDSFHPAVLKLIALIAENAEKAGIPAGICGELASHAAATPLLIGLGIKELSLPPSLLLELKNRILKLNYQNSVILKDKLLKMTNSNDILKILEAEEN